MLFEELRFFIVLVGTMAASYTDIKTGLIYDRITYPMIALGICFTIADVFYEKNMLLLLFPLAIFSFSYVLYFLGKLGGGDVKIFLALSLLLPSYKNKPFFISALFAAALVSVVVISAFYLFKFIKMKKKPRIELNRSIVECVLLGIALLLYFATLLYLGLIKLYSALFLAIPLAFALIFLALRRQIQGEFFLRWVRIDELEEDEIIAKEFLSKDMLDKLGASIKGIITEKDKEKLKKLGITRIPVYRDLPPFAPFLLIGVLLAYFWPDLFLNLFAGY